ncbi:hypothetical protein ACIPYS_09815 [Kitasatospora sp. NPDC089913]|uniref:hypothetical protein n=1 Tax=Kitasatospora sp. NPDC089913 TaxID=3364080 RepID=UPI0037F46AC4
MALRTSKQHSGALAVARCVLVRQLAQVRKTRTPERLSTGPSRWLTVVHPGTFTVTVSALVTDADTDGPGSAGTPAVAVGTGVALLMRATARTIGAPEPLESLPLPLAPHSRPVCS